ncbi:MAG: hypothetical protein COV66_02595 [Nitrospinae bacterium CG11_big_fil_rev_8_21_14_0_20_45_15]|nr:MAG: hypothetical protein COV66_02595 [Nitrospinae bacterium CG11_big_fil_rev_8_21_14_0_20_45_15]
MQSAPEFQFGARVWQFGRSFEPAFCMLKFAKRSEMFKTHTLKFEIDMIFYLQKDPVPIFLIAEGCFNDLSLQTHCARVAGQILAEYS